MIKNILQRTDHLLFVTIAVMTIAGWTNSNRRSKDDYYDRNQNETDECREETSNVVKVNEDREEINDKKKIRQLEEEVKQLKAQISHQTSFNTDVNRISKLNVRYYPTPIQSKNTEKNEAKVLFSSQSESSRNENEKEGSPSSICDTPESSGVVTPLVQSDRSGRPTYTPTTSRIMTAGRDLCIQVQRDSPYM